MLKLDRKHRYYCGIDPGFNGALALLSDGGDIAYTWDMETTSAKGKRKELDLIALDSEINYSGDDIDICYAMEWNTTRPHEPSEACFRFGLQTGAIAMCLTIRTKGWYKIPPAEWKKALGLPGKDKDPNSVVAAKYFIEQYPQHAFRLYGPRGGLRDGRLDALLIAHYMRITAAKLPA